MPDIEPASDEMVEFALMDGLPGVRRLGLRIRQEQARATDAIRAASDSQKYALQLEAELAQARASRDGWERDALVYAQNAGKAEAERDAAVAQVAVLVEALTKVRNTEWNLAGPANIDHEGRWYINREVHESLMATVLEALAQPTQEAPHG